MLFFNATAPLGWTKSTTHNDKAIRIVNSTGGASGGSLSFSTVFARTATDPTTLTAATMPSHSHAGVMMNAGAGPTEGTASTGQVRFIDPGSTAATGGGGSHMHGMDIRVQYVDALICVKN